MTNKINDIDVSKCGFCCWKHNANELIENYCAIFNNKCICNPDCYFKQLKRLQEENKRLQMLSCANCGEKYLSPDGAELYEKNVQLQKENEELKARLQTLDDEVLTVEITLDEFERYKKYKQTLEKIRDIAQIHQYFNPELLEIKGDIGQIQDLKMTEIFKKCNEVLNES